jgi:hypothetical protein
MPHELHILLDATLKTTESIRTFSILCTLGQGLLLESGKYEIRNFARSIMGTLGQRLINVCVGKELR